MLRDSHEAFLLGLQLLLAIHRIDSLYFKNIDPQSKSVSQTSTDPQDIYHNEQGPESKKNPHPHA